MDGEVPSTLLFSPGQAWFMEISFILSNTISSFLGTLTIILYILFKKNCMDSPALYFTIVTTCAHFAFLIGPISKYTPLQVDSLLCQIQGGLLQYFNLSGACWFLWIALQLYLVIVKDQSYSVISKKHNILIHVFSWGLPLICTVLNLAIPKMTFRITWCFVNTMDNGLWEWVGFYVPVLLIMLLVIWLWGISVWKASKFIKKVKTKTYLIQNMVGVFCILSSYIIQCAHRAIIVRTVNTYPMQALHNVMCGLAGTMSFFIFGLTPHHVESIMLLCKNQKKKPNERINASPAADMTSVERIDEQNGLLSRKPSEPVTFSPSPSPTTDTEEQSTYNTFSGIKLY